MSDSDEIIGKLKMIPHPEGGYFKESYRNEKVSLIYYLLKKKWKITLASFNKKWNSSFL